MFTFVSTDFISGKPKRTRHYADDDPNGASKKRRTKYRQSEKEAKKAGKEKSRPGNHGSNAVLTPKSPQKATEPYAIRGDINGAGPSTHAELFSMPELGHLQISPEPWYRMGRDVSVLDEITEKLMEEPRVAAACNNLPNEEEPQAGSEGGCPQLAFGQPRGLQPPAIPSPQRDPPTALSPPQTHAGSRDRSTLPRERTTAASETTSNLFHSDGVDQQVEGQSMGTM
ncbi:hypothetical protein P691DRAFT_785124, partial [Macrolepiota fuliginosa MF-IS2]